MSAPPIREALLDNDEWTEGKEALANVAWPPSTSFFSACDTSWCCDAPRPRTAEDESGGNSGDDAAQ
jgi:hypothetical protein